MKKLRQQTSAGMMDCKKALAENGGDFEKATEVGLAPHETLAGCMRLQPLCQHGVTCRQLPSPFNTLL